MDALAPGLGRDSVVILPTSTSVGADACIVVGDLDIESLKGVPTYGLEKSVAQYAFVRNLQKQGKNPADYPFKNMDPAAASQAMQTNQENIQSIQVWNPFVLQTLRTRDGSKVLFDSSTIPEEIIDCVVVGKDVLERPKGEEFACCVIDTYYSVCRLLEDPEEGDATLVALGEKFSNLGLEDMKLVVQQTRFYDTPDKALGLFNDATFQNDTMPTVVQFCLDNGIVDKRPSVAFDQPAQVSFITKYIERVKSGK